LIIIQHKKDDKKKEISEKLQEKNNVRDKYKPQINECTELVEELQKSNYGINQNIKLYDKKIKEIENKIAGEIECPKCEHHFLLADKEFDIEKAKKIIIEYIDSKK